MEEQFFTSSVTSHFNLRHHILGKPSPIYLVLRIFNKQYKIPLGVRVMPEHWNKNKALIAAYISTLDNRNNKIVNDTLAEYHLKFLSLQKIISDNPDINIKETISSIFNMAKKTNKPLAIAVLRTLLREKPMGDSSRKIFNQQLDNFYEYLKTLKKDIYMDDIDVSLMRNYLNYLHNSTCTHNHTGETVYLEDNTVKVIFGNILTILGYAEKADMIDLSKILKLKEKGRDKTEENQVYLDDDEFEIMKNIQLTSVEENVRDIFLFQLELGQRFSDITEMMGKQLSINNNVIELIQKKTGARVTIPLTPYALSILKKYSYTLPTITNAKMNTVLKKIGKKCNITSPCQCREMRNGKAYTYSVEKWEMIGTHTARRSFISNNIKEGISPELIRSITGHTSGAFDRYNRVSQTDLATAFQQIKNKALQDTQNNKMDNCTTETIKRQEGTFPAHSCTVIDEYRKVLTMLCVNPVEWIEITDVEELFRIVVKYENNLADKVGISYKEIKELFNNPELSLMEKITIINNHISK